MREKVLKAVIYIIFDLMLFCITAKYFFELVKGYPDVGPFDLLIFVAALCLFAIFNAPFVAEHFGVRLVNFLYPENRGEMPKEYSKAKSLVVRRMYDEAIKKYREALEEDPQDVQAQGQIAEIYHEKLKDYERAILEYRKVLEMEPQEELWVFTINRIADIYSEKLKRPLMAEEELKRIISKHPGTKQALAAQRRIDRITHI